MLPRVNARRPTNNPTDAGRPRVSIDHTRPNHQPTGQREHMTGDTTDAPPRRVGNRGCNAIDTHSLLVAEIYGQGGDSNFQFGQTIPPASSAAADGTPAVGFEDVELYFDSVVRDGTSDYSVGEIRWDIPTINNSTDIKNCVQMHVGEIYFPKIAAPSTKPDFFYFQRVFLEFQGAPSNQAVLGPATNRHHFEFQVQNITGQAVRLVPIKKSFFFQRPLLSITDFQVRFMVPSTGLNPTYKKIPIPLDTVRITTALNAGFGYNPIRFTIQAPADTTSIGAIGAITQVAVFISGYATPSPAVNAAVNDTAGNFVTNIIDANTFEVVGIDGSALTALYTATMLIPKNRVAFAVRFSCTRDMITNHVDIVHN